MSWQIRLISWSQSFFVPSIPSPTKPPVLVCLILFSIFFFLFSLALAVFHLSPTSLASVVAVSFYSFLPPFSTKDAHFLSFLTSCSRHFAIPLLPTQLTYLKFLVAFPRPSLLVLSRTNVLFCASHSLSIHTIFPKSPTLFSVSLYSSYPFSSLYILLLYTVPLPFILLFVPVVSSALVFSPNSHLPCFPFPPLASHLASLCPISLPSLPKPAVPLSVSPVSPIPYSCPALLNYP